MLPKQQIDSFEKYWLMLHTGMRAGEVVNTPELEQSRHGKILDIILANIS